MEVLLPTSRLPKYFLRKYFGSTHYFLYFLMPCPFSRPDSMCNLCVCTGTRSESASTWRYVLTTTLPEPSESARRGGDREQVARPHLLGRDLAGAHLGDGRDGPDRPGQVVQLADPGHGDGPAGHPPPHKGEKVVSRSTQERRRRDRHQGVASSRPLPRRSSSPS